MNTIPSRLDGINVSVGIWRVDDKMSVVVALEVSDTLVGWRLIANNDCSGRNVVRDGRENSFGIQIRNADVECVFSVATMNAAENPLRGTLEQILVIFDN